MFNSAFRKASISSVLLSCIMTAGCGQTLPWPASPLYSTPVNDPGWVQPATKAEATAQIVGHYAHYDIVAYDGKTANGPLGTFIISYGFTDFVEENGKLVEYDRFCHAEHKSNQPITTTFSDAATQAIKPRKAVVDLYNQGGVWKVRRPATPTLLGVDGDPDKPLTTNVNDPLLKDDDGDGKPGVTVNLKLWGVINGEIYIIRREIFQSDFTLYSGSRLQGLVTDHSEQLVVGASIAFLNQPSNPPQYSDLGLSPVILVPISASVNTCEELMQRRNEYFPKEPEFKPLKPKSL